MFYGNYAMQLQHEKVHLLERIANHLLINSSFLDDLGLFHGKMGIVIFFYHYSRYTNEPMYELLGENLIENIYENIHKNMPVTMDKGLCGIAWGLCSLLEDNFLEGDVDEILSDIDNKIMERDPIRITDLSFNTGLEGIWCYVQKRIAYAKKTQRVLPFDEKYRDEIGKSIQKMGISLKVSSPLDVITIANVDSTMNFLKFPLGLDNGCAGVLLKHILK